MAGVEAASKIADEKKKKYEVRKAEKEEKIDAEKKKKNDDPMAVQQR